MTVPIFPFKLFKFNMFPETVSKSENSGALVPKGNIFDEVFDINKKFCAKFVNICIFKK